MRAYVTIGDFSRMTHLSVKTLRYYHRVGLLEPTDVNPDTGYRYYGVDQVTAAHTIRRLRDLEMPVDEVRAVLAAPNERARDRLLAAHLDRMQAQLAQTEAAVASLRSLLEHPATPIEVERRSVPAMAAIAISDTVGRAELGAWWTDALNELYASLDGDPSAPDGPAGGLFDDGLFTDDRGDAVLFIPTASIAHTMGRVRPYTVPAAELAVAVHRGSFANIDQTYGALGTYVAEHGIGSAGPVRETYLAGVHDTMDTNRWRTEVCWPI
jgi:DNA-binding transcriptional MerR regulator